MAMNGNMFGKYLDLPEINSDVSIDVQPDCLKGRVVCGTVYGVMYLKDLLESIVMLVLMCSLTL